MIKYISRIILLFIALFLTTVVYVKGIIQDKTNYEFNNLKSQIHTVKLDLENMNQELEDCKDKLSDTFLNNEAISDIYNDISNIYDKINDILEDINSYQESSISATVTEKVENSHTTTPSTDSEYKEPILQEDTHICEDL
jgi:predicted  nucleic acid-binding Zn-ribbon protein